MFIVIISKIIMVFSLNMFNLPVSILPVSILPVSMDDPRCIPARSTIVKEPPPTSVTSTGPSTGPSTIVKVQRAWERELCWLPLVRRRVLVLVCFRIEHVHLSV